MLVTSRNRQVREFAPLLSLDVFDEETAVEYLIDRAERPQDRSGAKRLARALGYLPLALSHAAAYCLSGESFDDYLGLLETLPARQLFDTNPEASYRQTVASTWRVSIKAAGEQAPLAGPVLELAAHVAPDGIPRSMFSVLIDVDHPEERKAPGSCVGCPHPAEPGDDRGAHRERAPPRVEGRA